MEYYDFLVYTILFRKFATFAKTWKVENLNSFIIANLIGAYTKVFHKLPSIEVDKGKLRVDLPFKNKNKPPRLSTDPRYLSKLANF